jgi:hypothetical protein
MNNGSQIIRGAFGRIDKTGASGRQLDRTSAACRFAAARILCPRNGKRALNGSKNRRLVWVGPEGGVRMQSVTQITSFAFGPARPEECCA